MNMTITWARYAIGTIMDRPREWYGPEPTARGMVDFGTDMATMAMDVHHGIDPTTGAYGAVRARVVWWLVRLVLPVAWCLMAPTWAD